MEYIDKPLYNTIYGYLEENQYGELDIDDICYINSIEVETSEFIKFLGIRTKLKGYRYLKESISFELLKDTKYDVREDRTSIATIANKNHTEKTNVERSIRYAIQDLKKNKDCEDLNKILGCNIFSKKETPSNMEFIFCVAEKIRNLKAMRSPYKRKMH